MLNLLLEAVLQRDRAVEDKMLRSRVAVVEAEVALTHELEALGVLALFGHRQLAETGFDLAAGENLETVGIDAVKEVLVRAVRLRITEQIVVETNLGVDRGVCVDPVDGRALDLAPVGRITAAPLGVILAVDLRHTAVGVLLAAGAGDQIRALEANLEAGVHTLVFRLGNLHEVVRFDPQLAGEADLARAVFRTQGIILDRQKLGFALRLISIPPAIGMLLSAIPTLKYAMTDKEHDKILKSLVDKRNAQTK